MKLSVVVITYNEEELLGDCLKTLSFADEILIVDSGSTDKTLEIAKKYNAKITKIEGNDFSEKRNKGLVEARGDWILYVDADERVTEELKKNILTAIDNPASFGAYSVSRKNFYLGKPWPELEIIPRLFHKKDLIKWVGKLHESPVISAKVGQLDGQLVHFAHRSLSDMVKKTNQWSETEASLRLKANHPTMSQWRFFRVMGTTLFDYYVRKKGYKAGTVGVIESMYQSFSIFITYAKLWERQKK